MLLSSIFNIIQLYPYACLSSFLSIIFSWAQGQASSFLVFFFFLLFLPHHLSPQCHSIHRFVLLTLIRFSFFLHCLCVVIRHPGPLRMVAFGHSASFGAGLGKNSTGAVGKVRLMDGMCGATRLYMVSALLVYLPLRVRLSILVKRSFAAFGNENLSPSDMRADLCLYHLDLVHDLCYARKSVDD